MRKRTPLTVCVYKITSPNGGVYIGSTKSLNKRYTKHKIGSSNKLLRESVEKYGWDAHIKEIIVECEEKDMKIIERSYIAENLKDKVIFNVYGKGKTSKYNGVYWSKIYEKWLSAIWIEGNLKNLGLFKNEFDAHIAYELGAKEFINNQKLKKIDYEKRNQNTIRFLRIRIKNDARKYTTDKKLQKRI